jgi:hypothetical protein
MESVNIKVKYKINGDARDAREYEYKGSMAAYCVDSAVLEEAFEFEELPMGTLIGDKKRGGKRSKQPSNAKLAKESGFENLIYQIDDDPESKITT